MSYLGGLLQKCNLNCTLVYQKDKDKMLTISIEIHEKSKLYKKKFTQMIILNSLKENCVVSNQK